MRKAKYIFDEATLRHHRCLSANDIRLSCYYAVAEYSVCWKEIPIFPFVRFPFLLKLDFRYRFISQ